MHESELDHLEKSGRFLEKSGRFLEKNSHFFRKKWYRRHHPPNRRVRPLPRRLGRELFPHMHPDQGACADAVREAL